MQRVRYNPSNMSHAHRSSSVFKLIKKEFLFFAALILLAIVFSFGSHTSKPFASAEVQFTDSSASGLAIVPASCPSNPHFAGDCSAPPPPPPPYGTCSGSVSGQPVGQIYWQVSAGGGSGGYTYTWQDDVYPAYTTVGTGVLAIGGYTGGSSHTMQVTITDNGGSSGVTASQDRRISKEDGQDETRARTKKSA